MKIDININSNYTHSSMDIRGYVNQKLRSALKNSKQYIDNVIIGVTDLDNPKGGTNTICTIQLFIPGQIPVDIMTHGSNVYTAISSATNRAGHKSQRRIRSRRALLSLQGA